MNNIKLIDRSYFVTTSLRDMKVYPIYIHDSGGFSVGQNKLLQLILGYIYILKYLQSNFIGKILFF